MQFLIYGDIGGNFDAWAESLAEHGCKLTDKGILIPKGKRVIQVGDLIDRGPRSDDLVFAVDRTFEYYQVTGDEQRYFQILGNHEGNQIGGARFQGYDTFTSDKSKKRLRKWWEKGLAHMACGVIDTEGKPWLITHAGLSLQLWKRYGMTTDLAAMVAKLNSDTVGDAFDPGDQLASWGGVAGVAWADCLEHVYAQWAKWAAKGRDIPFNQVHGHSSAHKWSSGITIPWVKVLKENAKEAGVSFKFKLDAERRFTVCTIEDAQFWGIDQKLGKGDLGIDVEPLVLEGDLIAP